MPQHGWGLGCQSYWKGVSKRQQRGKVRGREEKEEDVGKMSGALSRNGECEDKIVKGGAEEMHGEVQGRAGQSRRRMSHT